MQNDTDSWKNTLRRTVCPLLVELVAKEQYDLVGCLLTLLLLLALDGHMDAREVRLILKSAFLDEIDGTEETLFLVLRKVEYCVQM